jgi:hypothetical protein
MNKPMMTEILNKIVQLEQEYNNQNFLRFKQPKPTTIKIEEPESSIQTFSIYEVEKQRNPGNSFIQQNIQATQEMNYISNIKKAFEKWNNKVMIFELNMQPAPCSTYIEMIPDVLRLDEESKMMSHLGFNFLVLDEGYDNELKGNLNEELDFINETFVFDRDLHLIVMVFRHLRADYNLPLGILVKILSNYFELRESLVIKCITNPMLSKNPTKKKCSSTISVEKKRNFEDYEVGSMYENDFDLNEDVVKVINKYTEDDVKYNSNEKFDFSLKKKEQVQFFSFVKFF